MGILRRYVTREYLKMMNPLQMVQATFPRSELDKLFIAPPLIVFAPAGQLVGTIVEPEEALVLTEFLGHGATIVQMGTKRTLWTEGREKLADDAGYDEKAALIFSRAAKYAGTGISPARRSAHR